MLRRFTYGEYCCVFIYPLRLLFVFNIQRQIAVFGIRCNIILFHISHVMSSLQGLFVCSSKPYDRPTFMIYPGFKASIQSSVRDFRTRHDYRTITDVDFRDTDSN